MARTELQSNTLAGLGSSLFLAVVKFAAGWWGHSTALMADAVESLADSLGSVLVWQALRVANRPPDDTHPYGYGKAEAVAAFSVGGLLIVAACFIIGQSFHEILIPHEAPEVWTLGVLLTVVVVKEFLFRMVIRGADAFDSDAARADAWHHRSDALTSLAALIGVSVAIWGPVWFGIPGLVFADEVAAILASGVILITALGLIRPALFELLDAVAHEMVRRVHEIASRIDGVVEVEKVFVRKSGSGYHVDMHLHVNPDSTIRVAHALSGKVKAVLRSEIPNLTGIMIHIEPGLEDVIDPSLQGSA